MNIPKNLFYTKDHEWIEIDDKTCKIGITDFAQGELGDIVFMEMPEIGTDLKAGDSAGTIEAVKTVADIYTPINGTIIKCNDKLIDTPELINSDPYGNGWIILIEADSLVDKNNLLTSDQYQKFIK